MILTLKRIFWHKHLKSCFFNQKSSFFQLFISFSFFNRKYFLIKIIFSNSSKLFQISIFSCFKKQKGWNSCCSTSCCNRTIKIKSNKHLRSKYQSYHILLVCLILKNILIDLLHLTFVKNIKFILMIKYLYTFRMTEYLWNRKKRMKNTKISSKNWQHRQLK